MSDVHFNDRVVLKGNWLVTFGEELNLLGPWTDGKVWHVVSDSSVTATSDKANTCALRLQEEVHPRDTAWFIGRCIATILFPIGIAALVIKVAVRFWINRLPIPLPPSSDASVASSTLLSSDKTAVSGGHPALGKQSPSSSSAAIPENDSSTVVRHAAPLVLSEQEKQAIACCGRIHGALPENAVPGFVADVIKALQNCFQIEQTYPVEAAENAAWKAHIEVSVRIYTNGVKYLLVHYKHNDGEEYMCPCQITCPTAPRDKENSPSAHALPALKAVVQDDEEPLAQPLSEDEKRGIKAFAQMSKVAQDQVDAVLTALKDLGGLCVGVHVVYGENNQLLTDWWTAIFDSGDAYLLYKNQAHRIGDPTGQSYPYTFTAGTLVLSKEASSSSLSSPPQSSSISLRVGEKLLKDTKPGVPALETKAAFLPIAQAVTRIAPGPPARSPKKQRSSVVEVVAAFAVPAIEQAVSGAGSK